MKANLKSHWENVYKTKTPQEVSWTQKTPKASLELIQSFSLSKKAKIIDVGGGDSNLVDHLLENGYENITVLDISAKAIERAKIRLGAKAEKVNWIVCDILDFKPNTTFDIWHDRAAFHFLTTNEQTSKYIDLVSRYVGNYLVLGTFSKSGPQKCSGLEIKQYSEETLTNKFKSNFNKIACFTEDHMTPFKTTQNFLFCSFNKV